jgi:hypothetical protein
MHGPEMWWLLMMACWSIENGVQECGMFALCHVALKDFAEPCPLFHKTKAVIRVLTVRTVEIGWRKSVVYKTSHPHSRHVCGSDEVAFCYRTSATVKANKK